MSLYVTVPAALVGAVDADGVATGIFEDTFATPDGGRKTVLTFKDVSVALVDDAGVKAYAGTKIVTLADGLVVFEGAMVDLTALSSTYPTVTGVVAAWDGDVALGSTTAIATGATLDGTEADLVPSTATVQAVAGLATVQAISTTTEAPKTKNGTTTPFPVFLNIHVDDGDQDVTTTPTNLILNGKVVINWKHIGDYA
jgi:hypothetical protein